MNFSATFLFTNKRIRKQSTFIFFPSFVSIQPSKIFQAVILAIPLFPVHIETPVFTSGDENEVENYQNFAAPFKFKLRIMKLYRIANV